MPSAVQQTPFIPQKSTEVLAKKVEAEAEAVVVKNVKNLVPRIDQRRNPPGIMFYIQRINPEAKNLNDISRTCQPMNGLSSVSTLINKVEFERKLLKVISYLKTM